MKYVMRAMLIVLVIFLFATFCNLSTNTGGGQGFGYLLIALFVLMGISFLTLISAPIFKFFKWLLRP